MSEQDEKADGPFGVPSGQEPLYGEGGKTPDAADAAGAEAEAEKHAEESGAAAEEKGAGGQSSGMGGGGGG